MNANEQFQIDQWERADEVRQRSEVMRWFWICFFIITLVLFLILVFGTPSYAYSDQEYVAAIRRAEGVWTYGIKTEKCDTEASCKKIALRTVHNNRIRYIKYGFKRYSRFDEFLQSRYCPNTKKYPHQGEVWLKNVRFALKHPKKDSL